jgi:hypothetical protein
MDYRYEDVERFEALLLKTEPFAKTVSDRRVLVRTDIRSLYRGHGIKGDIGHAFLLAGTLFLFSETFAVGEIAADYSRAQEFIVFPWGTNSITNPLFASSMFRIETPTQDVRRSEKMTLLAKSPTALRSLSFCKNYKSRPHNCGICSKCMRTKAMFIASPGEIPPIFADNAFSPEYLDKFDLAQRNERAFFLDLYLTARRNGNLERLPGVAEKASCFKHKPPKAKPFAPGLRWLPR